MSPNRMDSTNSKSSNRKGFLEKVETYSKSKTGLPPGSLIYFGENTNSQVEITCYSYNAEQVSKQHTKGSFSDIAVDAELCNWINVSALHNVDRIQEVGSFFNLHRLLLEDVLDTSQRPKFEAYDGNVFLTLKMLRWSSADEKVYLEQVSFVLGKNYVVSFQETEDDVFSTLRTRLEAGQGQIRSREVDYLFYRLLDTIVDHYLEVVEVFTDKVEMIENEALLNPKSNTVNKIQKLRKQLRFLTSTVLPLKDAVAKIEFSGTEFIQSKTIKYFKDVHDHLLQCSELLDQNRDGLLNSANLYHGSLSTNMNNVMKVLAIISTIFMPLSFIAGVYGMNFHYMPELEFRYGYPLALTAMFTIVVGMFFYFRNKKWF